MENLLNDIILSNKKCTANGKVASYIPELKNTNGDDLG
ncbi:glutaminase A, partial [Clostridium perfringens]|nr:glutaminase A [Clostridium perfringens]